MTFDLDLFIQIIEVCIVPLLGILVSFLVQFLSTKIKTETGKKYLSMVESTIYTCVMATKQTYVESLKAQGKFDEEAQKIAFQKTFDAIILVLSDDAKKYLQEVTGDLTAYLTQQIEAQVNTNK